MKINKLLPIVVMCASSVSIAQQLTVSQPEFPKAQQEKQLDFTPPNKIGAIPANDDSAMSARSVAQVQAEPEQVITLADDGKILITSTSDRE